MEVIERKLAEIIPYENNPRNNEDAVDKVAESLKEFGWQQPIVVDSDGVVIAGHTRLKAAQKLGMETAPVVVADGLTDEQVRAYRLADNKTAEFSGWKFKMLDEELSKIGGGIDMSKFGFNLDSLNQIVEDDFEPDPPEEPHSMLGDVYLLGRHRLMCGDSTDINDVEKLMDGAKADMLLTDPPYNVDYQGAAGSIENDNMEDSEFRAFLASAFYNAKESMKPGAAFHIWHADSEGYNFRGAVRDAGLMLRQCLIWVKNRLVLGRSDFQWMHEPCLYGENPPVFPNVDQYTDEVGGIALYGWKDGTHYWFKNRKQTTVLKFDKPTVSKEHPTMKPVLLFNYEMECNTQKGDTVLDLFAGSGTTIIAAEQNGRVAYCMEYDPKYVDVIISRWEKFTGKKATKLNE